MFRAFAPRTVAATGLALVAVVLGGCSSEVKVVPAEGVLKIGGKPAPNVSVQFLPDVTKGAAGPTSYAMTDAEGRFKLKTQDGRDGAVPGPHTVILADLDEERPPQGVPLKKQPRLSSRYTTASGGLKAEVPAGGGSVALEVP
jgi:hypothetical protein